MLTVRAKKVGREVMDLVVEYSRYMRRQVTQDRRHGWIGSMFQKNLDYIAMVCRSSKMEGLKYGRFFPGSSRPLLY